MMITPMHNNSDFVIITPAFKKIKILEGRFLKE